MSDLSDQTKKLSTEEQFVEQLRLANEMVAKCLAENRHLTEDSIFDRHDLFRIAMNSFKTAEEKLSTGIRRRVISGV